MAFVAVIRSDLPTVVAPTRQAPPIAIVHAGPRGPAGVSTAVLTRIAAQALGGHRVVRAIATANQVDYASADQVGDAGMILGVTTGAVSALEPIDVQTSGEMVEGSWTWTPGPVFCGLNGALTQTPPAIGFIRQIGIADRSDRIVIDLRMPFVL